MRADICDPSDKTAVVRFRESLKRLGTTLENKDWALGTDIYDIIIGGNNLRVWSDEWSIDVEGPEPVVRQVLEEFNRVPPS